MYCVTSGPGRSSPCERPADCCQQRVTSGQDQPGRHGDAADVHVHRGKQAWHDPAHRGQARRQEEPGGSLNNRS